MFSVQVVLLLKYIRKHKLYDHVLCPAYTSNWKKTKNNQNFSIFTRISKVFKYFLLRSVNLALYWNVYECKKDDRTCRCTRWSSQIKENWNSYGVGTSNDKIVHVNSNLKKNTLKFYFKDVYCYVLLCSSFFSHGLRKI